MAKPFDGDKSCVVVRVQHMPALGQMAGQQPAHGAFVHAAAFLQNHVVLAPFRFEEDRRVGLVVVVTQPKFEPVPIAIDGVPVSVEAVRIEVKTERGIGQARLKGAVFVNREVGLHKIPNAQRLGLRHVVFQFESLML